MAIHIGNENFGYFGHGEIVVQVKKEACGTFEPGEAESLIVEGLSRTLGPIIAGKNGQFLAEIEERCRGVQDPAAPQLIEFAEGGRELLPRYLPPEFQGSLLAMKLDEYQRCGDPLLSAPDPENENAGEEATGYIQVLNLELDYEVDKTDIDRALLYLVGELRIKLAQLAEEMDVSFTVSPNWRFNAAPAGLGSGGPGKRPVRADIPASEDEAGFQPLPQEKIGSLDANGACAAELDQLRQSLDESARESGDPNGINVYVLDTLPSTAELWKAAGLSAYKDNPAINSMFAWLDPATGNKTHQAKGDCLEVTNNGQGQVRSLTYLRHPTDRDFNDPYYYLKNRHGELDHPYNMVSHGPFIANTIRMLAPSANLHLVRVLNDHGIGSMRTIQTGLNKVYAAEKRYGNRFIVNLSLTIGFNIDRPLPTVGDDNGRTLQDIAALITFLSETPDGGVDLDYLNVARALFTRFPKETIVAAAGNDSLPHELIQTGFPAELDGIIGVGAVGSDLKRAPYSNRADTNPAEGYWAFGGDPADAASPLSHSLCGMLSIYTHPYFPDEYGKPITNDTGWGRWAGTSFATPVVAGLMARLLSSGVSRAQIRALLTPFVSTEAELDSFPVVPLEQLASCNCPTADPNLGEYSSV